MTGATTGGVRLLLRAEGLCVLAAALLLYSRSGFGWGMFALFFLAPDLSFFGYLGGARVGAIVYNAAHSHVGPIACLVAGYVLAAPVVSATGIVWAAHVGFDRALGYGLKYAAGFGYTHLGRIGRQAETAALRQPPA
jgi:hypothetical protein